MDWDWLRSLADHPWPDEIDWVRTAAVALEVVLLGLVLAWLGRRSAGEAETGALPGVLVLRYATIWRRLFVALGIGMLALLGAIYVFDPPSQWEPPGHDALPVGVFGGMTLVCLAGYLETARTRVEVSASGVTVASVWRGERHLAWHQIDRVSYSTSMMWFVLHGGEGTRLRVSHTLRGVPALGARVREHLGESVYGDVDRLFDATPFAPW